MGRSKRNTVKRNAHQARRSAGASNTEEYEAFMDEESEAAQKLHERILELKEQYRKKYKPQRKAYHEESHGDMFTHVVGDYNVFSVKP